MTHLVGLVALNLLFLLTGGCLLWGLRGWSAWTELAELGGVAYMLGIGVIAVAATVVLATGGSLSVWVILLLVLILAGVGLALGVQRRRPLPRTRGSWSRPRSRSGWAGLALAGLTLVLAAVSFRAAYHAPVIAWDAWAFWIPKAKAIYFFGGLDPQLFRSLPGPSYPLLVPALDAMDFHFMGSADVTLLAVQYWLLFWGFALSMAGLLRRLVPPMLVWLFLALGAVLPEVDHRLFQLMADWPLDVFFVLAALALVCFLRTGETWLFGVYGVGFAAMLATKREGQLLGACLIVSALAATVWRRRRASLAIVGIALAAYAINLPWRVWWTSRGLGSDMPDNGLGHFTGDTSRILPGLRLVLELLFNYHFWLIPVPVAIIAAVVGLSTRERELPVLYIVASALAVVGFAWVIWSDPSLPISTKPALTPIPRAVGAIALLSIALAPLLFDPLLRDGEQASHAQPAGPSRTLARWNRRRVAEHPAAD